MKAILEKTVIWLCFAVLGTAGILQAQNQTNNLSPVYPGDTLPFRLVIEEADFSLPVGIQDGAFAVHDNKWLLIAGRLNGLHGFESNDNNFPPNQQNTLVLVVDPKKKVVYSKSLLDPTAGLSQDQVDLLSVTAPQYYQKGRTLYMTGGYGVISATGDFSTKNCLTAIDIPGLMHWVIKGSKKETAAQHIRQIFDPIFQVTGGKMYQFGNEPTLLVFGQNFMGAYNPNVDGDYIEQVQRFYIQDDGKKLSITKLTPKPGTPDPSYRRRDLNVVPIITGKHGFRKSKLVALAGVFTVDTGVWTVPVEIKWDGSTHMADPSNPNTFKQAMNQYDCAYLGMYSKKSGNMYTSLFGGISFGYFQDGVFTTDDELPFINQVTTIRIDAHDQYKQYLMPDEYPVILSQSSNSGSPLYFGAGAYFIRHSDVPVYKNGVIKMDELGNKKKGKLLGYIVGGIQSSQQNTTGPADSAASPFIFKVIYKKATKGTL